MNYGDSYSEEVAGSHADYRTELPGESRQTRPGGNRMRSLLSGLKHRIMRPAVGPMVLGAVAFSMLIAACEVPIDGDIVINTDPLPAAPVGAGEKPAYDPVGEALGALQELAREEQEIMYLFGDGPGVPDVGIIGDLRDVSDLADFDDAEVFIDNINAYDDFSNLFVEGDFALAPVFSIGDTKPAPKAAAAKPKKVGLVFDGGDKNGFFSTLADNMAEDGGNFSKLLKSLGYDVTQYSQYWGNSLTALSKSGLQATIEEYAAELKPGDSFFIEFTAHGNANGFSLYKSDGSGKREWVTYSDLGTWLNKIDKGVKMTIVIDACECGGAIPYLKGPNRTIITATDNATSAAGGVIIDSFIEDFLEAYDDIEDADTNKDGVVSLKEAFKYAEAQGESYHPQFVPPTKPEKKAAGKGKAGVSDDSGDEVAIGPVYYPVFNIGNGGDDHSSCEVPQGGFQCGNQYLWWLDNHVHVAVGGDIPENDEHSDDNADHSQCEMPEGGFQCGQHMLWWLNNHDHVTVGNDVPGGQDEEKKPEAPKGTGTNDGGSSNGTSDDDDDKGAILGGDSGTDSSVTAPTPSAGPKDTDLKTNSGAKVKDDPTLPPGHSYGLDTDGDGKVDVVVVGTLGGKIGKGGKTGVTVSDPDRSPDKSVGVDVDGDGTIDIIIVGTKGAKLGKTENGILIIEDPNLPVGQSYEVDVDGDYKIDIRVIGTKQDKVETNINGLAAVEVVPTNDDPIMIENMPGNVFNVDNDPDVDPQVQSGCGGAGCTCNYYEVPPRVPDMYLWGVDIDGDGIDDIILSTTDPAMPFPGVPTGTDTDGDGYFDSLLMPQGPLGPCDDSSPSDEGFLDFGFDTDGDGVPDTFLVPFGPLSDLEIAPMEPLTVIAVPVGIDTDGDGYPDALPMPQGPLGPPTDNSSTGGNSSSTDGNSEVDLTKMTYDELFDLFLSTDISHDLWKKVLEEMQRRDEAAADDISGSTVTLANPALTAVGTSVSGGATTYTIPDSNGGLTTAGKKLLEEGLSMGAGGIDDAIKAVGYTAASEGWLDDATKTRLTGAGALSTTMKVAGKGLMVYGVYSGLDRAASTTDEGEKARGYLDATWSAVPGPIGIAGALGNAAGQQIEKIDTGTATADGGSTIHDWLTAAGQEYFENGFVDTFISGWSMIFN